MWSGLWTHEETLLCRLICQFQPGRWSCSHLKTSAFFTRQSKAISRTSLLQLDEAAFKIPSGIVDELRCSICWLIGTRVRMSEMLFVSSGIRELASQRWDRVLNAPTALLSLVYSAGCSRQGFHWKKVVFSGALSRRWLPLGKSDLLCLLGSFTFQCSFYVEKQAGRKKKKKDSPQSNQPHGED